jgi:iron complex transport system permease protein
MPSTRVKSISAYAAALLFWFAVFALALGLGSSSSLDRDLILGLRLPRAILASAVGAGLAISGAVLQAVFSNPLCEPYTIGISAGAAIGTVIGFTIGSQFVFSGMAGLAFLGALLFAFVLHLISRRTRSSAASLLLAGVMLQFLGSSIVALWMAFADPSGIQGALSWLLGDLSRARLAGSLTTAFLVLALGSVLWMNWRPLDAFLTGEESARALGIDTARMRRRLIFLTSLLIGGCVSGAGMIGFVGLIVPHLVRRQVGSLHFKLLPLCLIWGAAVLTLADTLARVVARPYELPVGVVTALIGAPLFLMIVVKKGASA